MSDLQIKENTLYFYSSHKLAQNIEYQKHFLLNAFDAIALESLIRMLTGIHINWDKWIPLKVITSIQSQLRIDNKYVFDITHATENKLYFYTTHKSGANVEYQKQHLLNKFSINGKTSLYKMITGQYGKFSKWVHIPVLKPTFMLKNNSIVFYTSNYSGGKINYQKKYLKKILNTYELQSIYSMLSGNNSCVTKLLPLPVLTSSDSELVINNKTVFNIENSPENKLYFYTLDVNGDCADYQKKQLKHAMSNKALNSFYRMLTGNYGIWNNWICLPVAQPLNINNIHNNELINISRLNKSIVYETIDAPENTIYFYTQERTSGIHVNYQQQHLANYDTPDICISLFNMLTGLPGTHAFKVLTHTDSDLKIDNKNVFELSTAPKNSIYFYTSNPKATCFDYQQYFLTNYRNIEFRSYFLNMLINNCEHNVKAFSVPVLIP